MKKLNSINQDHINITKSFNQIQREENMKKNIKKIVGVIACVTLLCAMTGCAMLDSAINDLKGSLIGNGYVIDTYDNYGN